MKESYDNVEIEIIRFDVGDILTDGSTDTPITPDP